VLCAAALLAACRSERADNGARASSEAAPAVGAGVTTSPDGIAIAYEAHGDATSAPALIFVHGWSCDRSYWSAQLEPFARDHRVVAVDLAGHGQSALGRADYTMASFGGDVAAVVEALGLERVILIGHSMGGDVIAEAARRLPGRVAGLVWVDTYRSLGSPRTTEQLESVVAPLRADFVPNARALVRSMFTGDADSALVERVALDMSAAPPDVAVSAVTHALSYDREMPATVAALKLPVVAINPDNGPTDTDALGRHGVRVVLMNGVGHFLMMEDPERFNGILRSVIDSIAH
jgi:pimeloyl-ACP methyl ester carboxylesterase